jgi:hypothetical protein
MRMGRRDGTREQARMNTIDKEDFADNDETSSECESRIIVLYGSGAIRRERGQR